MGSGYIRSGLVSVSGVMVLGVLTLDYRVKVKSVNRKRANPRKSDAGFQVLLHHDSEKGVIEKTQTQECQEWYGAIVLARVKEKVDARMCVVCLGYMAHEEELEKGTFVCVIGFLPMVFEPAPPR